MDWFNLGKSILCTTQEESRQLRLIGAQGILKCEEIKELQIGERRVLTLLQDGKWHQAETIRLVAGGSEGLRRLRSLRAQGYKIERRRSAQESRHFEYRLIK